MRKEIIVILYFFCALSDVLDLVHSQVLSPPPINIARGKKIVATSTCGVGVNERELFCKLASVPGRLAILGLSCDHCDPSTPSKTHPIEYAIDGTEKWWQSPPLSRGLQYQEVNITIDLGQEYQVAYVIVKTGNAPRPGTWALEKSIDDGKTFTPWQYFATTNSECINNFGFSSLLQSFKDDTTVTCTTSYSQVPPFENGEIHISLVNGRPGAANFSYSQTLQEWTRATHIRLRLLKVKTLLADLLPLARKDPSVTRRYFYSIKDISVGGICMCNGHADACVQPEEDNSQFVCKCKHQTCGIKCEKCCPGYIQKKWRPATVDSSNECEPCNCHNHAVDCYYDERIAQQRRSLDINGNYEGGGVCVNCQHNTVGINCQRCKAGYYRPTGVSKTSPAACQACNCDRRFATGRCYDEEGACECLENFSGPRCDNCNEGFYGFPNCKPCDCHPTGTSGSVCGPAGNQCPCKPNYTGAKCDQCAPGYYGFPACRRCNCDRVGSIATDCELTTGQCRCRQMYTGRQCNQCSRGFYSFPECNVCNCDAEGTAPEICNPNTGDCICMESFAGPRCDVCNEGYYKFPDCTACKCSPQGSLSPKCSAIGSCECKSNYVGEKCDRCDIGFFNYPQCIKCACDLRGAVHQFCEPSTGQCTCKGSYRGTNCNLCRAGYYGFPNCRVCQCNPAGIKPIPGRPLGDCSFSNEGQCDCKDNVQGLECTECKDGYFYLQSSNPVGCDSCQCNWDGVIGSLRTCNKVTGQCPCKLYVTGQKCTSCKGGFYGLGGRKVFGCTGCDCDVGGAYNQNCDETTGQCRCRPNIIGRDCGRPAQLHFYPELLHIKAEMEDGTVPSKPGPVPGRDIPGLFSPDVSFSTNGRSARFGFDESVFPGFSWRGYATMSDLQKEVKVTLDVPKTTRYHIIFRYVLNESSAVTGEVVISPKGRTESKQSSKVTFPVTGVGSDRYQTVGENDMATQFMLTKGQWDLTLMVPSSNLLLDYVVGLPQEYYEAYELKDKVTRPCHVNGADDLCNQFSYPSMNKPELYTSEVETGYIIDRARKIETQLFEDESVLKQLDFTNMALLDSRQSRVTADISIPKKGKYVLVMQYYHPSDTTPTVYVYLRYRKGSQRGSFHLHSCNYRFGCRQVAVDGNRAVKVFDVAEFQKSIITLLARSTLSPIAIDSVTAIPLDMWTLDFIAPNIFCTAQGGKCVPTSYPIPKGVVKIEANGDDQSQLPPSILDPTAKPKYLEGPKIHDMVTSVPRPGRYAVIVHYYQPNHPSFDSQVTVTSNRGIDGAVKFHFCPHVSGCRAVIRNLNRSPFFEIGGDSAALQFSIPRGSSTLIDYVLLVPEALFTMDLQDDSPIPLSQEFLATCSKDQFSIQNSDPRFCRDSVFSLTTSFNDGSMACNCNQKGSLSSECAVYGGQCSCRPNVIGRTCSRCRTGYFGFPECKKCTCVFCNEITGVCDCPSNTVGPNCEFCLSGTYGYDPILGCQNCECDRFGVKGGNIACDASTGQCDCKPSHTGRQCNQCATGYFSYPVCQKCNCDPRGVDERVCSESGQCYCKPGVVGPRCDKCAPGYYNLDGTNPAGCTKCWCNSLSDTCFSGNKYWSKVDIMDGWELENSPASVLKIGATNLYASISSQRTDKDKPVYWLAPKEYLGKKIASYGGKLTYTARYEVPQGDTSLTLTMKPDVVLEGKNGKTVYYKKQLKISPGVTAPVDVKLTEDLWEGENATEISRDDFMAVLLDLHSMKLRASYNSIVADVTINDVEMNIAVDGPLPGAALAKSVEMCDCPVIATGASCELCGQGYTRAVDNKTCIPCNCFGHSYDCDPETGKCPVCQHNTTGDNCEECEPGFYGDATVGSPIDCSICECPLGTTSNSFATSCSLNLFNQLQCVCHEGYIGQRCEKCADGYYGNPSQPGDYCKRCACSGNIDLSVNGSCDPVTGRCRKCINAATGDKCDRCLDGYFGDAVVAKSCARCACDECGTETAVCNHKTGICTCKPNVVGNSCDQCKPNTWNFDSCLGCEDCACAPAALASSCDVKTGQCLCPIGVTGRQCDRCQAGYFRYTSKGCTECNCPKGPENLYGFCDVNTGECCKPGGDCEICPVNYILTPQGCEYCGECVGRLLNTVTVLDYNLTTVLKSLEQGTAGIIAESRLDSINRTLQRLIPPTNKYHMTMESLSQLVGVSVRNGTALPRPLAIYPLNSKYGGTDIGPNSNPAGALVGIVLAEGPYGKPGGSVQLAGAADSYIEIPNGGALDMRRSASVLIWVYHEELDGPLVDYEAFKTVNLWLDSSNQFEIRFMDRDKNAPISRGQMSMAVQPRTWNHVATTYDYDSGVAKIYVNENLEEEVNIGVKELATNTAVVRLGSLSGLPNSFKGRLACVQFYDTALTVDQIKKMKSACDPDSDTGGFDSVDLKGTLTERADSYETKTDELSDTVAELTVKAENVLAGSTSTKDDALLLEKEIMDALNKTLGIVDFVKMIAETLKKDKANQTQLLEKAEEILEELDLRDFDPANVSIMEEEQLVILLFRQAEERLGATMALWDQLIQANKTLDELLGKFGQILRKTISVLENVTAAMATNNVSRGYDSETAIKEAEMKKKDVEMALVDLQGTLDNVASKLANASISVQDFNGSFPQLDQLIEKVNEKLANLTEILDELNPLVVISHKHGQDLRKQADDLEKLLRDIEFANKAFNASQRYSDIADALKEALAIAQEAWQIAWDARNESQSVSDQAKTSQNTSSVLADRASDTEDKVDNELSGLLDEVKDRLDIIREKIRNVTGALFDIAINFPRFEEMSSLGDQASSLEDNATESKNTADAARKIAEDIEAKLPGLSGLKESIIATNNNMTETEEKVRRAVNDSYAIRDKVVIQEKRQEKIIEELNTEVVKRLDDIKEMIAGARRLLKFTSLVLRFDGDTATSPIPPPAVEQESRALDFLMYMKPEKPDGLVLYMGNTKESYRQKRQARPSCGADFVALELEARKVHFKLCADGNFYDVISKTDITTEKPRWHKIEASMTGGLANLQVTSYDDNKKIEDDKVERNMVANKNPRLVFSKESDLVVGGVPMGMQLPPEVENRNYTGCFDGLQINDHYVGTWNSDPLENPGSSYCLSRDGAEEFATDESENTFTFFGVGFIKSGIYDSDAMGELRFKFQTTSSDGILVLGIDDDDTSLFQALELRNGFLVYSYNMGHGFRRFTSENFYDKGEEVTIEKQAADRRGFRFNFHITSRSNGLEKLVPDGTPFYEGNKRISFVDPDYVYWGGIENRTNIPINVTRQFFKGCLSNLKILNEDIKFGKNSTGYIPGCEVKITRNATFIKRNSYLRMKPFITSRGKRGFTIGLSFRTQKPNGLLLLEAHSDDRDFIALGLVDGKVVFKADPGRATIKLETDGSNYGDGLWHFVTAQQDGGILRLYVDDETIEGQFDNMMIQTIQTTMDMFLGGVPMDLSVLTMAFQDLTKESLFGGAIRDLTLDYELVDFSKYKKRDGVVFDLDDYSEQAPKNLIITKATETPPGPLLSTTTLSPTPEVTTTTSRSTTKKASTTRQEPSTTPPPTTPTQTTTVTTTPTTIPSCSMPSKPAQLPGVMQFGNDINSHAAYTITGNNVLRKLIGSRTKVTLEFRAANREGILFYSAQLPSQSDFVECHLVRGRVSCGFSAGGGILTLTSSSSYSDGQWHTLRLIRKGVDATLFVDDSKVDSGKAQGSQQNIDGLKELYIGGTPLGFDSRRVPKGAQASFPGCIRNVTVSRLPIGPPTAPYKIQECYADGVERGVSFLEGGGYLVLGAPYTVGIDEEITLEIKPTSDTGLLLSSSSKQDYIVLELVNGTVIFRAQNGGGELKVSSRPGMQLCDGFWHKIHVWKKGKIVELQIDDGQLIKGGNVGRQTSADIADPLYIGGLPEGFVGKGVTVKETYTGCIRNLVTDSKPMPLSNPIMMTGNIYLGGCPYLSP